MTRQSISDSRCYGRFERIPSPESRIPVAAAPYARWRHTAARLAATLLPAALLTLCSVGCGGNSQGKASEPPAKIANPVKEADLSTITLTAEAEQRLGIETTVIQARDVPVERQIGGELLLPPGRTAPVAAPVGGRVEAVPGVTLVAGAAVRQGQAVLRLVPQEAPSRDLRVTYETDLAAARARFEAAERQLARARQLLKNEVGSQKSVEQAESEFAQAKAANDAASERLARLNERPLDADITVPVVSPVGGVLRQVFTAPGQVVTGGAPLFEAVDVRTLWVRVPLYVGDLAVFRSATSAAVDALGGGSTRMANRVKGPPTADAQSSSADLYFQLDNPDGTFRPGQQVGVTIAAAGTGEDGLVVPASAIAYDYQGGTWVYVNTAEHTFVRQRVAVARSAGSNVVLARGPAPGSRVVTVGVAELFGTEFGAGK